MYSVTQRIKMIQQYEGKKEDLCSLVKNNNTNSTEKRSIP